MEIEPSYQEKDLIQQFRAGSEAAFSALFRHYRGRLYHYILTLTASREMAEDTVHDVFLKIWNNREPLAGINNMNAYLFRVCHNQAISGLRRMARETLILAERYIGDDKLSLNLPLWKHTVMGIVKGEIIQNISPMHIFIPLKHLFLAVGIIADEEPLLVETCRIQVLDKIKTINDPWMVYGS